MISQTQTSSNQYGFYAVPKKLEPKKKYRQQQYEDSDQNDKSNQQNEFEEIQKNKTPEHMVEKDFYVDQAPYPQFKPKQRGLDYGVQIQKGDLFDYQLEVQPLLEILVGRSVVSAINELQQEKEKQQKKQKLQVYQNKRNAELMVTQRLQAKSTRKKEQSERRVLQKQIFVKNQKEVGKKIIARKNAKSTLLGLKNQLFNQLQQAGYLRSQPYTDLRISYEGWLYQQVRELISEQVKIKSEVYKMINDSSNQNQDDNKKHIQKQKARRRQILNQRARIKKQNQQRKQKKRIRKQRLQLNGQRQPNSIKFQELFEKYQQLESILKSDVTRSNGFVNRNVNSVATVYIAGGFQNFLMVYLNSAERNFTTQQVQDQIFNHILKETTTQFNLEFQFAEDHLNLIQEEIRKMDENPNAFMKSKTQRIQELKQKLSISLTFLQANKISLKGELHQAFLQAILNIVLTNCSIPAAVATQQGTQAQVPYQVSQKDRAREQLKKRVLLKSQSKSIQQISQILRIRFQRKYPQEQQISEQAKQQNIQEVENQWIDVYDGEGWTQHCNKFNEEKQRDMQKPATVVLAPFENTFVYDQRAIYFLTRELQNLLNITHGHQLDKYTEQICHLSAKIKTSIPVYDVQIKGQ